MAATYTWDVFTSLDAFGGFDDRGDWGGYWGKEGPEFLARRQAQLDEPHRLVLGATTFRMFVAMIGPAAAPEPDPITERMRSAPVTVISSSLRGPQDWPDATIASGDAVELVTRLKRDSAVPLRSHGSPSLNRALLDAGLIDRLQVTVFPVLTGRTGDAPMFRGAGDFDLELLESTLLDGRIQELAYRPVPHRSTEPA